MVPAARLVVGAVIVTDGGVVSAAGAWVVTLMEPEAVEMLPAASSALTV